MVRPLADEDVVSRKRRSLTRWGMLVLLLVADFDERHS